MEDDGVKVDAVFQGELNEGSYDFDSSSVPDHIYSIFPPFVLEWYLWAISYSAVFK